MKVPGSFRRLDHGQKAEQLTWVTRRLTDASYFSFQRGSTERLPQMSNDRR